jgi:hypothetical protein
MAKFTVRCDCPTPLLQNPFECEAETEASAKSEFFAANGISGSDHPIEITQEVSEVVQVSAEVVKEVSEVVQPGKGRKKNEPQSTTGDQG